MVGRYAALANASRSPSQWWPCRAAGRASASGLKNLSGCSQSDPAVGARPQQLLVWLAALGWVRLFRCGGRTAAGVESCQSSFTKAGSWAVTEQTAADHTVRWYVPRSALVTLPSWPGRPKYMASPSNCCRESAARWGAGQICGFSPVRFKVHSGGQEGKLGQTLEDFAV